MSAADRLRYLKRVLPCHDDSWWVELTKAFDRSPHDPEETVSIASSSPINTWYCTTCHQTYLSISQYICTGGYVSHLWEPIFGSRASNLQDIWRCSKYS
ncbi:MAG: hypothetical protein ACYTEW_25210, partial [Planctomycetota bacterium]